MEEKYREVEARYERQCRNIRESLELLAEVEKHAPEQTDQAVNLSGKMLSEVFVYDEKDFWSDSLRKFGFSLGRFIYLMDAAMDYKKDRRKQNYNPLFYMKKAGGDRRDSDLLYQRGR